MNCTSAAACPALLLSALLLLSGCSLITEPDDTATLLLDVAGARVFCFGWIPQECLIVREGLGGDLETFDEPILGFDYEPGYRYRLLVTRTRLRNPPQDASIYEYRLNRVLSRKPSARADLLAETAAAEAKWIAARPLDYEMVERRVCFCADAALGPVRLQVTLTFYESYEGITSAWRVEDGSPVPQEIVRRFLSVQGLFREIRWAVADDVHSIDVEFDDVSGYPRRVSIDRRAAVSDDEVEYVVESIADL